MLQRPVESAVESGLLMVVGITMPHNNGIEVFARSLGRVVRAPLMPVVRQPYR